MHNIIHNVFLYVVHQYIISIINSTTAVVVYRSYADVRSVEQSTLIVSVPCVGTLECLPRPINL